MQKLKNKTSLIYQLFGNGVYDVSHAFMRRPLVNEAASFSQCPLEKSGNWLLTIKEAIREVVFLKEKEK